MKKNLLFIAVLLFAGQVFAQKLAPNALLLLSNREAVKEHSPQKSPSQGNKETEKVKVFVEVTNPDVIDEIEAQGGEILSVISDQLVTAFLPIDIMRTVADLKDVKYIQAASQVQPKMDEARKDARVDLAQLEQVELGTGTYSGKGVVFGIVDAGMEYGHLAFRNPDGTLRLKRVWNQKSKSGQAPEGYSIGSEYDTEEEILGAKYDDYTTFHATHVAGIAAGSDKTSNYYGVAPETDIVMVSYGSTDVDIVNGVKYIFDYATSVGKPCVVNLSIGSHKGPHDGTSFVDRAFDGMTGPGRIIVGAAGNEGSYMLHAGKKLTASDNQLKTMIGYESETATYKRAILDIWGKENSTMKVQGVVVDVMTGKIVTGTKELSSVSSESDSLPISTAKYGADGYITLTITTDPNNNRPNALLTTEVTSMSSARRIGVVVTGNDGDEIHLWNCYNGTLLNANKRGWTAGDNNYTVGEIGGSGKNTISVGSYNSRISCNIISGDTYIYNVGNLNDISNFSSLGPTLDGRTKPDVIAPGLIVSASSSYYVRATDKSETVVQVTKGADNTSYYYDVNGGTSMSSPFVAGSVALWLQANPNLTPENVKEIIQRSSRSDDYTGGTPNNKWGYGKIDTYAGLLIAATPLSLEEVEMAMSLLKVVPDRYAHTLQFFFADGDGTCGLNVAVYDTMGRYVANYRVDANGQIVDASALKSGLYILQVECNGVVKSEKVIL